MQRATHTASWVFAICCLVACSDLPQPPSQAQIEAEPAVRAPCLSGEAATSVTNLNFPDQSCETATALAEDRLTSLHYRRACQTLDQESLLPATVSRAEVTKCLATDGRGVFLDVEVCCPAVVDLPLKTPSTVRGAAPPCPLFRTSARARNLHYPEAENCGAIRADAESSLGSAHYRKACEAAVPRSTRAPTVIEAKVVECRSGTRDPGVYVDVGLCCGAKVFDEEVFRELVWQRSQTDVRNALGPPEVATEDPAGVHWRYGYEVARAEKIFPAVTLVFSNDVVSSYYFELVPEPSADQ